MTVAIVSNLPIQELEKARAQYKLIAKLVDKKLRIRYRGPRYNAFALH